MVVVTLAASVPNANEFHQDEKWFFVNTICRKRMVLKWDKASATNVNYSVNRKHDTKVMFTGCCGVGPSGVAIECQSGL